MRLATNKHNIQDALLWHLSFPPSIPTMTPGLSIRFFYVFNFSVTLFLWLSLLLQLTLPRDGNSPGAGISVSVRGRYHGPSARREEANEQCHPTHFACEWSFRSEANNGANREK